MSGKKWTEKEIDILLKYYGNVHSRSELLDKLPGRSYDAISMKATCLGLKGDKRNSNRQYDVNFSIFNSITSNSAYWAGFIAADGHITINNQLMIGLSIKDSFHIEKLKKYIEYSGPIKTKTCKTNFGTFDRVNLVVQCRDICNDLHHIFNIPKGKKSDILSMPNLSQEFLIDYICGYFDGDGCMYFDKRGYLTITFVGNKDFLKQIRKTINYYFQIKTSEPYKNTKHSDCNIYRVHGEKAKLILKRFAQNKNSMQRKRL